MRTPTRRAAAPARILYVHNSGDLYGASRSLVRLVGRLDRARFEPVVLLPEAGSLRARLEAAGAEVVIDPDLAVITRAAFRPRAIGPFLARCPRSALRVRAIVVARRIDLVHTNTGVIVSSALGARLAGVPHVWHIRDWFGEFGALWRPYSRYIRALSDRVIAVSGPIAAQLGGEGPGVEVVHNGFDLAEFDVDRAALRAEFRARFGLGEGPVVGVVGRVKLVRKGQEVLVRAAALLRDRGVDATFVLVGAPAPGSEHHVGEIERLAASLGVRDRVVLTGEVADARAAYAALDVAVLPSAQPEPFGGVVIEAMAMERPVVATAIGGSIEQVDDGVTGYLVPPGDPVALADRLATLIADPALARRLGEAGRRRVAERFSIDRMIAALERCYGEVLGAREPRA